MVAPPLNSLGDPGGSAIPVTGLDPVVPERV
jgi:hypothetical protein